MFPALPHPKTLALPSPETPADSSVDLAKMFRLFWSHLVLIIVCAALCLGAAYAYLLRTPKMYASTAVVEVKTPERPINATDTNNAEVNALEEQHTFEQKLTSRSVQVAVARAIGLDKDKRLFPKHNTAEPPTDAEVVKAMAPFVLAELRRGTRLVDLKVTYYDAETAKLIADKILEFFVKQDVNSEFATSRQISENYAKEADQLKTKLDESERQLQEFRESNSGVPLDEGYNVSLDRLKELNAQYSKAKAQRLQLESDLAQIDAVGAADRVTLLHLNSIATLPEVTELQKVIDVKEGQFLGIKEWCGRRHPKYLQAEKELEFLNAARDTAALTAITRIRMGYNSAKETEKKLTDAIRDQEKISLDLSNRTIPYAQLQMKVKADRNVYEAVTKRVKESEVSASVPVTNFRVTESPMVQPDPVSPRKLQILGLALFGGLAMGAGSAFGLEVIKSPKALALIKHDDATPTSQPTSLPVLAELPPLVRDSLDQALDCVHRRSTPECEAFRALRSSLKFLRKDREPRSVAVTGATIDVDVAPCALHLAATFVSEGLRTVIVGLDFNDHSLEKVLMEQSVGSPLGLADGLTEEMAPTAFCHPTRVPNLFLIPPGNPLRDPAALLEGPRFRELMVLAWNSLDRIILCAPPVLQIPEPLAPLRYAEAVCLVARSGSVSHREIGAATQRLSFPGHSPGGLIMQGVSPRAAFTSNGQHFLSTRLAPVPAS